MVWKIYFWVLTVLLVVLYVLTLSSSDVAVYYYLDVPVSVLGLVGLYGYAFKKRLVHANFWKVWFIIVVLWDIFFNLVLPARALIEMQDIIVLVICGAIIIPEYVALYLYGFRSRALWSSTV
jgi:hypothetical protein